MQQFNLFQFSKSYLLITVLLLTQSLFAQQTDWRWGIWGNTNCSNAEPGACTSWELSDMAVDPNGNLYTLSESRYTSYLNGQPIVGNSSDDILVSSFDCEGNYRWHKIISGSKTSGVGIKADTMGGVYITGAVSAYQDAVQFDVDTTIDNTDKTLFLIKYDTNGAYQWLRMPQPDTTTGGYHNPTAAGDLDVTPNGAVYLYTCLAPGAYADGAFMVTEYSMNILKYDAFGNFQTGISLEISISGTSLINSWFNPIQAHFKRHHQNGKYYLGGNFRADFGSMSFGNIPVTNSGFLGCFDSTGNFVWVEQGGENAEGYSPVPVTRPIIDNNGNVYINGYSASGSSWGGHIFQNQINPLHAFPFVAKLDDQGNLLWATNPSASGLSPTGGMAIQNNRVYVSGGAGIGFKWDDIQLSNPNGNIVFLAELNKQTGTVLNIDTTVTVYGPGGGASYDKLATDGLGNLFMGARTNSSFVIPSDTFYHTGGSFTWIVGKYGYDNCDCEPALADFEMAGASGNEIIGFSYTGEPAELVEWDFGDGSAIATGNHVNHTYAAGGEYTVCVTAYSDCGTNTYCETIQVGGADVADHPELAALSVYPNPASDALHIHGIRSNLSYQIYTALGRLALRGGLYPGSATIQTGNLASGLYILALKHESGSLKRMKVVIEQ